MKPSIVSFAAILFAPFAFANCSHAESPSSQAGETPPKRWTLADSCRKIEWIVDADKKLPHADNVEMSGKKMSAVLRYAVSANGAFSLERSFVYPMLRTIPNDTHASLMMRSSLDIPKLIQVQVRGKARNLGSEKVGKISFDGMLGVESTFGINNPADYETKEPIVAIKRKMTVSTDKAVYCERYTLKNISPKPVDVCVPDFHFTSTTDAKRGVYGAYVFESFVDGQISKTLAPDAEFEFDVLFTCRKTSEKNPRIKPDEEFLLREKFIESIGSKLVLKTPDKNIDAFFNFAKIRAAESIFDTACGPMHAPGGESFYAAIWANDQAEYVNPFFAFMGYDWADESVMNCFALFEKYTNKEFKPIPSSIIAEGTDFWAAAGDRGDAAMVAYGAARYALVCADREKARKLWSLISWCLEYCNRKLDKNGVVASDCDELENRFPAGDANLCTSSLYYDALISASYLARDLGLGNSMADGFLQRAKTLRKNIEKHFGAKVQGFDTYRYYDGNDKLRAWICIPLTVGITERANGTLDALFSDYLWTENGALTISGDKTFWDRVTLYALRGAFAAGQTQRAFEHLKSYTQTRLLGERVPYAVESYPERGMRQLSAESGLYCRIFIEGMFGIRPTGFKSFDITPRMPASWNKMTLSNIRAFGEVFDLQISRKDSGELEILLKTYGGERIVKTVDEGQTASVSLD